VFIKIDTTNEENHYCFGCKRVRLFELCDNCGKFFCPRCSGEWQEPELGDYGSIISPGYIGHTKC